MAPSKMSSTGPIDGGSSVGARFRQIPVAGLFLVAILVQATLQLRSMHQLFQHPTPEIPAMPMELTQPGRILSSEENSIDNDDLFTVITNKEWNDGMDNDEKTIDNSMDTQTLVQGETSTIVQEDSVIPKVHTLGGERRRKKRADRRKNDRKKNRKPKVIYGIMTYDSDSERKRRKLIRKTFLDYFHNLPKLMNATQEEYLETKHWICSLNDLDQGRLEHPEKCRMAYAFVQGANPNGTNMLLTFNDTYPLALPPPKAATEKEANDYSDMIFLNIKENGKFGKTPTWFRYAVDVLERHGWTKDWDYVFKSDSDNLLYTPNFFRYVDNKLPMKKGQLVYGGLPLDYRRCGGDNHDHCKEMIGPYFMQGGCYFLSTELATFVSNETAFDHQAVKLPHEDMTTGNFVYSHPGKIKVLKIARKGETIRYHPLKEERKFKFRWEKMLREERARRDKLLLEAAQPQEQ